MPLYEYICLDCKHEFEEMSATNDDTNITCPQCRSTKVQRQISAVRSHKADGHSQSSACSMPSSGFT